MKLDNFFGVFQFYLPLSTDCIILLDFMQGKTAIEATIGITFTGRRHLLYKKYKCNMKPKREIEVSGLL